MLKKEAEAAAEREREAQRQQGTPVTAESFAKWQAAFLAEMEGTEGWEKVDDFQGKVTGKQYFLDKETGGDQAEVEALEEELAELDVEDEEEVGSEFDDEEDDEDFLDEYLADAADEA